jgi:adenylate cyclase
MVMGGGTITELNDLRAPMSMVLDNLATQMAELERYKARFGTLRTIEN